jgi:hypothetical protein
MQPAPTATSVRLSWKRKAMVFGGSLVFILLVLSMVAGAIEDPMFGARARARLDDLQRMFDHGSTEQVARELGPIRDEIDREGRLMNRYITMNLLVAVANPLLAVWLVGRCRSSARFVLWMTLAGLFWSTSLTGTYLALHRLVLPGGLQDPRFREWLGLCLFASCLLNSLLVAGIALRLARPTPVNRQLAV